MATSHINGKHFLFFQAWFGSLVELELANTDLKRDPYFLKHFRFGHSKKGLHERLEAHLPTHCYQTCVGSSVEPA